MEKRRLVNVATVALLAVGLVLGALALYGITGQHGAISPSGIIPGERAVAIAENSSGLSQQELGQDQVDARLLQARLGNRVALVLEYPSMAQEPYPVPLRPFHVGEGQLFWEVTIRRNLAQYQYESWIYDIDARNGTVIGSYVPVDGP